MKELKQIKILWEKGLSEYSSDPVEFERQYWEQQDQIIAASEAEYLKNDDICRKNMTCKTCKIQKNCNKDRV